MNISDRGACSYYRAILPHRHCKESLASEGIDLVCSEELRTDDNYDAYIFHRMIQPRFLPYLEELKKKGKRIVFEMDDDVWNIPKWNPASRVFGQMEIDTINYTYDLADEIWVSTPELAAVVNRGDKVHVLPNLIDPSDYPEPTVRNDGRVRLVWAGSIHHDEDLEVIAPVVEILIERFGPLVDFVFFGCWPEQISQWVRIQNTNLATLVPRRDLRESLAYCDPVDLVDYPATLCGLGADIGLCPLVDVPFNYSKSGIKAWEYSCAGMVPVCTDLPPYGGNWWPSISKDNPVDEWVGVLDALISDTDRRTAALTVAREAVKHQYSWNSPGKNLWLDSFRRLV
jgi:glycosyltransferase involved in cell wall biosynthesis